MTRTMKIIAPLVVAAGLLAACGPLANTESPTRAALAGLSGLLGGGAQDAAVPSDPRRDLTRDIIEASRPADLMLVVLPVRDAAATATRIGDNRGKSTWITPDGIGLTFADGLLIATRGLGDDLMGADVRDTAAALQTMLQNGGTSVRIHDYLNGMDQTERMSFQCVVSPAGNTRITIYQRTYPVRKVEENCVTSSGQFTNTYWIEPNGTVRQSKQWISQRIGYIEIQRL